MSKKTNPLLINKLTTKRLSLIPYTIQICQNVLQQDFSDVQQLGLQRGASWPDQDVLETLPKLSITSVRLLPQQASNRG